MDQVISQAEFAINNTVCRSTGNTLSQLLFGLDQLGEIHDLRLSLDSQTKDDRNLAELREAVSCKSRETNSKRENIQ